MHCRPSVVYGFTGLRAYYFDSAVVRWGTTLAAELQDAANTASHKAKSPEAVERAQTAVLRRWLGPQPGMYRDPAAR